MKFLHAADLHIDSPLRGLAAYEGAPVDEIRGATRRAVENLVGAAVSNRVDLVVVAGDIFDGDWKDYSTGLFWVGQLARLHDEGIPVVVVAGNHDAMSEIGKRLSLPPNVSQLASAKPQSKRFDDLDVVVVGQSYATRSVTSDLAATYPAGDPALFNIGLLHTSLDGRPGHASYAPTTLDVLRGCGYQYWALGHVHQREVVSTDPWIVFPGNLQGRQVRETGSKGASLVTVTDGEVRSVDHLELDVVRWADCAVDVGESNAFEDVVAKVSDALDAATTMAPGRMVAARVNIVGQCSIHNELWKRWDELEVETRALGAVRSDLWIEKVKLGTRRPGEVDSELVAAIEARAGELRDDPDAFASVEALFADLRNKLPPELKVADVNDLTSAPPGSAEHIRGALDSAVDLVAALLSEVDPS